MALVGLDTFRAKRAGQETAAERRFGLPFEAGKAVLPSLASDLVKPVADELEKSLRERLFVPPDLAEVIQAFAEDLQAGLEPSGSGAAPATSTPGLPAAPPSAVLLIENLDRRPDDTDTKLLVERLLPAVVGSRVRVLATVRREESADALTGLGLPVEPLRLAFFSEPETRDFAREQIGIVRNEPLVEEIWRLSAGSPQRLAILHRYFQRKPGERRQRALAEAARYAVATEQATDLLSSAETEFQQELIRAVSVLRSFNSELAEEVFTALSLTAREGEPSPARSCSATAAAPAGLPRRSGAAQLPLVPVLSFNDLLQSSNILPLGRVGG